MTKEVVMAIQARLIVQNARKRLVRSPCSLPCYEARSQPNCTHWQSVLPFERVHYFLQLALGFQRCSVRKETRPFTAGCRLCPPRRGADVGPQGARPQGLAKLRASGWRARRALARVHPEPGIGQVAP